MTTECRSESEKGQRMSVAHGYAITKHGEVWMLDSESCCSAERAIAVDAMLALGLDPNDWRLRDKLIQAISPRVTGMLDYAHNTKLTDAGTQASK